MRMLAISLFLTACIGAAPVTPPTNSTTSTVGDTTSSGSTAGGVNQTFNHDNDQIDPFDVLERIQTEGPPEIATRMHSCQKLRVATLGTILAGLGVDLGKPAPSAGDLYSNGFGALGAANYGARIPEAIESTTAGSTKLFDILVAAAPEIIANMSATKRCAGVSMFDASGACTLDGISCLKGLPATAQDKAFCDNVTTAASTPEIGQTIAVASVLAAAHTCE